MSAARAAMGSASPWTSCTRTSRPAAIANTPTSRRFAATTRAGTSSRSASTDTGASARPSGVMVPTTCSARPRDASRRSATPARYASVCAWSARVTGRATPVARA
ncbi:MAG: hypothetical protein R3A52_20745 [Polyangiales bacterium]